MSEPRSTSSSRARGTYSRLICLGCHERRIRCELPSDVEIPNAGELRTVQTPCYRCERLGIPCVIRKTMLGRPGRGSIPVTAPESQIGGTSEMVELPSCTQATFRNQTQAVPSPVNSWSSCSSNESPSSQGDGWFSRSDMADDANSVFGLLSLNIRRQAKVQILPLRRVVASAQSTVSSRGTPSPCCSDSQVTAPKRVRESKSKVRTGCLTCKIRRVKCDENKPACLKCTSTGRKCDGYLTDPPSKGKNAVTPVTVFQSPQPTKGLALSPLKSSPSELRGLEYFCVKTAPNMGMYFDADFWRGFVVQASVAEPALRHAVVAVGVFAEQRARLDLDNTIPPTGRQIADKNDPVALRSYNKSIGLLAKLINSSHETTDTVVLACILFVCVEFLRGEEKAALRHFRGGMAIIVNTISHVDSSPGSRIMVDYLKNSMLPFFTRLDLLSTLFGDEPSWPYPVTLSECIPTTFSSLGHARDSLVHLMNLSLRFIRSMYLRKYEEFTVPPSAFDEQAAVLSQLLHWHSHFTAYKSEHASELTINDLYASNVLEIQRTVAYTWVSASLSPYESVYDMHIPTYTHAVDLAEQLSDFANTGMERARSSTPFIFDVEVVGPIFLMIVKCREPTVRRRALAMLRGIHRREGLWDPKKYALLAERIIKLEEALLTDDGLPSEEARVHMSFILNNSDDDPSSYLITLQTKPYGVYEEWSVLEEQISLDGA